MNNKIKLDFLRNEFRLAKENECESMFEIEREIYEEIYHNYETAFETRRKLAGKMQTFIGRSFLRKYYKRENEKNNSEIKRLTEELEREQTESEKLNWEGACAVYDSGEDRTTNDARDTILSLERKFVESWERNDLNESKRINEELYKKAREGYVSLMEQKMQFVTVGLQEWNNLRIRRISKEIEKYSGLMKVYEIKDLVISKALARKNHDKNDKEEA